MSVKSRRKIGPKAWSFRQHQRWRRRDEGLTSEGILPIWGKQGNLRSQKTTDSATVSRTDVFFSFFAFFWTQKTHNNKAPPPQKVLTGSHEPGRLPRHHAVFCCQKTKPEGGCSKQKKIPQRSNHADSDTYLSSFYVLLWDVIIEIYSTDQRAFAIASSLCSIAEHMQCTRVLVSQVKAGAFVCGFWL